jgi:hypothetical protein
MDDAGTGTGSICFEVAPGEYVELLTGGTCEPAAESGGVAEPPTIGEEEIRVSGTAPPPCPAFGCLQRPPRRIRDRDNLFGNPDEPKRGAQGKGKGKAAKGRDANVPKKATEGIVEFCEQIRNDLPRMRAGLQEALQRQKAFSKDHPDLSKRWENIAWEARQAITWAEGALNKDECKPVRQSAK